MPPVTRSRTTLALLLLVLVVIGGLIVWLQHRRQVNEVGTAATDLLADDVTASFTTLVGGALSFESYRGTVRVVNVWAGWSPYATTELPVLDRLAAGYDPKQVTVIALNRSEPKERAQAFLNTLPELTHLTVAIDPTDIFYRKVGGYAMPETFVFSSGGDLLLHHRGVASEEALKQTIDEALQTK